MSRRHRLSLPLFVLALLLLFGPSRARSTGPAPAMVAVALEPGWNLVTMPLDAPGYRAATLCADVGPELTTVLSWQNGLWTSYSCGLPFGDFALQPGQGYFVLTSQAATWSAPGTPIFTELTVDLENGWTAVGLPYDTGYRASDLCAQLDQQGAAPVQVLGWSSAAWQSYSCGLPFGDFPLSVEGGYFVRTGPLEGALLPYLPTDAQVLYYSQGAGMNGGSDRTVLLRWQSETGGQSAEVFRRAVGQTGWEFAGRVEPAADADEMRALLGEALTALLALDLRADPDDPPLSPEALYTTLMADHETALLYAAQFHEVALVTGDGFIDAARPGALEYRVVTDGGGPVYGPILVPEETLYALPPLNLREVYSGPEGLGVRPSPRPVTAEERYDWTIQQSLVRHHGTAFLNWDLPVGGGGGGVPDGYAIHNIASYNVYRRGPATGGLWQLANPRKGHARCAGAPDSDDSCFMQVRGGSLAFEPPEEEALFEDNLLARFPTLPPSRIFAEHEYRVCPVDWLGQEAAAGCEEVTVPIRELRAPAPVVEIEVVPAANHASLTLQLTYSDTEEVSGPVTLYVMRHTTPTLQNEDWSPIAVLPGVDPLGTTAHSVQDEPGQGEIFWYTVEVRDNAGNWAGSGEMVRGVLHPRAGPPLEPIAYNPNRCATNPMPLPLSGLDPAVRQLILYRAFQSDAPFPGADWAVLDHIQVVGGTAELRDPYVPPTDTHAYYRVVAADGHGNLSDPILYCTALAADSPPEIPRAPGATVVLQPEGTTVEVSLGGGVADPVSDGETLTLVTPSASGGVTATLPYGGAYQSVQPLGTSLAYQIASSNEQGTSSSALVIERFTNDFMDTERQMTNLGILPDARWTAGGQVELLFPRRCPEPLAACRPDYHVALYRQGAGGHWLQVSPVSPLTAFTPSPHYPVLTDTSSLDPTAVYTYTALAFSPNTFEVKGYFQPRALGPRDGPAGSFRANPALAPPPVLDPACTSYDLAPAAAQGLPSTLWLHNDWRIEGLVVYVNGAAGCPAAMQGPVAAAGELYGEGTFTNGFDSWPAGVVGIAMDGVTGDHLGGRIAVTLDFTLVNEGWQTRYSLAEFYPGQSAATLVQTLPPGIRLYDPAAGSHHGTLLSTHGGLDRFWQVDPLSSTAFDLVDERLPWRLQPQVAWEIQPLLLQAVDGPSGGVLTVDRLAYTPPPITPGVLTAPDNNLAYLRVPYEGQIVIVDGMGLDGYFFSTGPVAYATSLPAGLVVSAAQAELSILDGEITGGVLNAAALELVYDPLGSWVDDINQLTGWLEVLGYRVGDKLYQRPTGYTAALQNLSMNTGVLDLGYHGRIEDELFLTTGDVIWPRFRSRESFGTVLAAAVSFPDEPPAARLEPAAPMPAENAWRRYPDPTGAGDFDPGVNLNVDAGGVVNYSCYAPDRFEDMGLDLYVRRGGVSENLRIVTPDGAPRLGIQGYQLTPTALDALFLDNYILEATAAMDLYLPYPSEIELALRIESWADNCPGGGTLDGGPLRSLHRYWNLTSEAAAWAFGPVTPYAADVQGRWPGSEPAVFQLLDGSVTANGMVRDPLTQEALAEAAVLPAAVQEWLPDGDFGRIEIRPTIDGYFRVSGFRYAPRGLRAPRFHQAALDPASLPDLAGYNGAATFQPLPAALLDARGEMTPSSLAACAQLLEGDGLRRIGCGPLMLDGDGYTHPFGPVRFPAAARDLPEPPAGEWPLLVTAIDGDRLFSVIGVPEIRIEWPAGIEYFDLPVPVVLQGNVAGGAIAGVFREVAILPPRPVLTSDLGFAVTARFTLSLENPGFDEANFGLFFGAAASQGAFRALAMHRPLPFGPGWPGFRPYDSWPQVESDIERYATKFGFPFDGNRTNANDPVDLAHALWVQDGAGDPAYWGTQNLEATFAVVEPLVRTSETDPGVYGVGGLDAGVRMLGAGIRLEKGLGQVTFRVGGDGDVTLGEIGFASRFKLDTVNSSGEPVEKLIHIEWLSMAYTRDGDFFASGEGLSISMGGVGEATGRLMLHLLESDPANDRFEGSVVIDQIVFLEFLDMGNTAFAVGAGLYNNQPVGYAGFRGEVKFLSLFAHGSFLAGSIYKESVVLRDAGFDEILDKLPDTGDPGNSFGGAFVSFGFAVPFISTTCVLEVSAYGELQGWYFYDLTEGSGSGGNAVYGGTVNGAVTASALCLIHARGDLTLTVERLAGGSTSGTPPQTCPPAGACGMFSGRFWIAIGIGFCSPNSWRDWDRRWWGDSWCYQLGAVADLSYLDGPGTSNWEADFDLDFE